jgi:2-polyprenyl-3-methyl-5-hydroxy-6-metoxy-1,4-benzoquinol methylase
VKDKLHQIKALLEQVIAEVESESNESIRHSNQEEILSDFEKIKILLDSEEWPEAVFSVQIADENSEQDKEERAQGISSIMLPPLENKRFLDFGCGEGHVARLASEESILSVGYDIEQSPRSKLAWENKKGNFLLTSNLDRAFSEGPFDVILMYDVIDHAKFESPFEMLSKAASLLAEDGRIYMRCHPWCGRHGGHLYRKVNKAFVHIVLSSEELESMGVGVEPNLGVMRPLKTYGDMISDAGLVNDLDLEIDHQDVESFFRDTPVVRDRILKVWSLDKWDKDPPEFQMSQCFIDYVLKKK